MVSELPQGAVTFLILDLVGHSSTVLKIGNAAAHERYYPIFQQAIRETLETKGGTGKVKDGDSAFYVFTDPNAAVEAANALHHWFNTNTSDEISLRARIGMHFCPDAKHSQNDTSDYQNAEDLIFCSRLMSASDRDQTVISVRLQTILDPARFRLHEWKGRLVRDAEGAQTLYEVLWHTGQTPKPPGSRYLPEFFREHSKYIARPEDEDAILGVLGARRGREAPNRWVTLWGFGGMGKTRLGLECAVRLAPDFLENTHFVALEDCPPMYTDAQKRDYMVDAIASKLGFSNEERARPEILPAVLSRLKSYPTLLLLDNFESVAGVDAADWIRASLETCADLFLLLTSREPVNDLDYETPYEVHSLRPEAARELLISYAERRNNGHFAPSEAEEPDLERILTLTARIPLAIRLAMAWFKPDTLQQIADGLETVALGTYSEDRTNRKTTRHASLTHSLDWSWSRLPEILQAAALRLPLFANGLEEALFLRVHSLSGFDHRTWVGLYDTSWVITEGEQTDTEQRQTNTAPYHLFRAVREYLWEKLRASTEYEAICARHLAYFQEQYQTYGKQAGEYDQEAIARLDPEYPHVLELMRMPESEQRDAILVEIATKTGTHYFDNTAKWVSAIPFLQSALTIQEKTLGSEHPSVAVSLNNLASLLQSTGRYTEPEPMYRRALEIQEKTLGSGHPLVAVSLNNLAGFLDSTAQYTEAEPMYRRVLEIQESTLGRNHPNIAKTLSNLGVLLNHTGNYTEAEEIFRRAIEIGELSSGKNHPDVANTLTNLASLLQSTKKYDEAEEIFRRVIEIEKSYLGENHPNFAQSLSKLASLLVDKEQYDEAENLFRRAIEIQNSTIGDNHLEFGTTLCNLATLLYITKRYNEAEFLFRQNIKIRLFFPNAIHLGAPVACKNWLICLREMEENNLYPYSDVQENADVESLRSRALEIVKISGKGMVKSNKLSKKGFSCCLLLILTCVLGGGYTVYSLLHR
jgi:tetratricopeptide (TPR) repeat protein